MAISFVFPFFYKFVKLICPMDFLTDFRQFISANGLDGRRDIVPVPVTAGSPEQAAAVCRELQSLAGKVMFVAEDRWRSAGGMMRMRILAHCGRFRQVYARNCSVRRIDRAMAAAFLAEAHSYGDALSRFRYGLFVERATGEKGSLPVPPDGSKDYPGPLVGDLVAVAEFSKARRRVIDGESVRTFEWVRYASLPGIRVEGGMGKVLAAFVSEAGPEDVMSYADLEWSDGRAYRELGFRCETQREPVTFAVDPLTWRRTALKYVPDTSGMLFFRNFGSFKYRLKLK